MKKKTMMSYKSPYEEASCNGDVSSNISEWQLDTRKTTSTAFILLFPALIVAGLAIFYTPFLIIRAIVIALAVYQFLMIKKFIEDFYKNR